VTTEEGLVAGQMPPPGSSHPWLDGDNLVHQQERGAVGEHIFGSEHHPRLRHHGTISRHRKSHFSWAMALKLPLSMPIL